MEKNIVMPRLRPEMEKGVLCAWLKEEGEPVSAGEPLFEIETDKVVNQIEATQDGVLKKQLIEEGDTVFDVLAFVCEKYKIRMSYRGGTSSGCYVEGINNLYEFDGGRWSGWMYCVNDWYPNYGCGVYFVKAGEVIEWSYTCDLGCDLENGDPYGYGKEWKDNHD